MLRIEKAIFTVVLAILFDLIAVASPPVAVLTDADPGIQLLFSGDPNTTESSFHDPADAAPSPDCAQTAPRAGLGDGGGKGHNELLHCDNWDFGTKDWGQAGFLQGSFTLGESPFSDDGGWECSGNEGAGGYNPCVNSTIRIVSTFKNTPPPGMGTSGGQPMSELKDWVVSFDFKYEFGAGDTFGADKLFEIGANVTLLQVVGSGESNGSFLADGTPHRYTLVHGTGVPNESIRTPIDQPLSEGKFTVHYKSANQRMDLWLDDTLLVPDFQGIVGTNYLARFIQFGGGGISFENALYDNVLMGVVAQACGPDGPGATGIPGDFNCDGTVDVADLGIVGANFNASEVTYVDGDANLDGAVVVADLGVVGANWTAAQSASLTRALQSTGLPEPATAALLGVGLVVCLYRARRRLIA